MSFPSDTIKENSHQKLRRFYFGILSISSHINPCPSCPYDCKGKERIGGPIMDEIVGCSRWP